MENYSSDQEANLLPNNRNETNNFSSSFTEQNFRDFLRNQENEKINPPLYHQTFVWWYNSFINKKEENYGRNFCEKSYQKVRRLHRRG